MDRPARTDRNGSDSGLWRYLRSIRRFPMLTRQEEHRLIRRWRDHGDRRAAHKLLKSHLSLVVRIARNYRGYGLSVSDLISEGNVGLMQALDRFESDRGIRFATYAAWWIRAAVQGYVLRSRSMVKVATTVERRRLSFKLSRTKAKIGSLDRVLAPQHIEAIAKLLSVTEQDVIEMDGWLSGDASLNAPLDNEVGAPVAWQDLLVDDRADQETMLALREEEQQRRNLLTAALAVLNERERRIFEARRLAEEPATLQRLGDEFGLTRERVRQIEMASLEKVKAAIRRQVEA